MQIMQLITAAKAVARNINRQDIESIVLPHVYNCLG
ncbi:MAG: hypothetical protein C5S48_07605 [Candidatus Methanogaster sp.]|nr:MAG: hypothetical protein C5S48_07605 [ANME-2 cluster archaeon]